MIQKVKMLKVLIDELYDCLDQWNISRASDIYLAIDEIYKRILNELLFKELPEKEYFVAPKPQGDDQDDSIRDEE